jgi:hypothetical protein
MNKNKRAAQILQRHLTTKLDQLKWMGEIHEFVVETELVPASGNIEFTVRYALSLSMQYFVIKGTL